MVLTTCGDPVYGDGNVPWAVETASLSPLAPSREFFSPPVTTCLENLL